MSVFVTLTVEADPDKAAQVMQANEARTQKINDHARGLGCIHHRFVGGDGVMMVMDEWDSADSFYKFFESDTDIPALLKDAGVSSAPDIKIWNRMDSRDEF
jgi:heme-degrading monooxygenase HmoA